MPHSEKAKLPETRTSRVPGKILLAFIVVALAGLVWKAWYPEAELVGWRDNYEAARAEARASGKPLLLYFTADWCGPCRQMRRTTWSNAGVKEALEGYVFVKIDVDAQSELAHEFGVDAIPRMIVMQPDGNVASSHVGFVSASDMAKWLSGW